jgi:hypothetical protein
MQGSIIFFFRMWVNEIYKTPMLPNIRDDDEINAPVDLNRGSMSHAEYTQPFNDFFFNGRGMYCRIPSVC